MIDLHTHVLPCVDDGPENIEEALKTVSELAAGGTRVIVATPHSMPPIFDASVEEVKRARNLLSRALITAGVQVEVVLGQEITFRPGILEMLEQGELLTIGGTKNFLMEFPPRFVPPGVRDFIFDARMRGFTPVLAHPERNEFLQLRLEIVGKFVEAGMLMQLTAASFLGRFGTQAQKASFDMLREGLVHVIATDSHSFRIGCTDLKVALPVAADLVGEAAALDLVTKNPQAIIEGKSHLLR